MHLKEAFKEFSEQTTFHGIRYIGDSKVRIIRRFIWLLLVLTAFGVLTLIIVLRVLFFYSSPKTVNIDIEYPDALTFPAVTVCNQNFIRASVAIDHGLYDSLRRDVDKIRRQGADQEGDGCQDTFYGYINTNLFRTSTIGPDDDVIFMGVTSEVCQHLCIRGPKVTCNGALYNKMSKSCTLTSKMTSSPDVESYYEMGTDYLQRIRCESEPDIGCSFEADLCNFTQGEEDDDDWKRVSGSVVVSFTGPDFDHTTRKGSYIYIDIMNGGQASLVSPIISVGTTTDRCAEFYYHMYGEHTGTLQVYIQSGDSQEVLVWRRSGNQGNRWRRGFFTIPSDLFRVRFAGVGSSEAQRLIALDDIRIAKCSLFRTDCKDRAEGAEYRGKVSRTRGGQQCVSWKIMSRLVAINPLHFADDNLEDAANFCRNPNGKHTEPWCYTDRQGAAWEACDIPFCECRPTEFTCGNGRCVQIQQLCDGGDDCGDATDETLRCKRSISCTFEEPFMCGYTTQAAESEFQWHFTKYSTKSPRTGPPYDNTAESTPGGYVYVDSTYGLEKDEATLLSPPHPLDFIGCLRFSYHMYGPQSGSLRVMVVSGGRPQQLFAVMGQQEDMWKSVALSMTHFRWSQEGHIRIAFVAIRGNGTQGDLAIDGVDFSQVPCTVTVETECDVADQQCANGLCVRTDQVCDGVNDCLDNTDEEVFCESISCSFAEPSGCGYTTSSTLPGVGWTKTSRDNPNVTVFDGSDVWNATDEYFMFSTAAIVGKPNVESNLYTPWWTPTSDACATYLWKPQGSTSGILQVFKQLRGMEPELVHVHVRDEAPHWLLQRIPVGGEDGEFRLIFRATSIYIGSDVALDNVTLQESHCDFSYVTSINCTFEDAMLCGYIVAFNGDFLWSRTWSDRGYAMSTDQLAISGPNVTSLTSPWQQFSSGHCLTFSYKLHGLKAGVLSVLLQDANYTRQIWKRTGDQGPEWRTVSLDISPGYWRLIFEAIRGYEKYTHIAVDYVITTPGTCSATTCDGGFRCDNGRCVDENVVCDGYDDCLDMSDEVRACDRNCKLSTRGEFYTGKANITRNLHQCVKWDSVDAVSPKHPVMVFPDRTPEGVLNHCRNPSGSKARPWCFTSRKGSWDYCNIEQCGCARNQFRCLNAHCVALTVRCDGKDDCGDLSDEEDGCDISIGCNFEEPFLCGYRVDDTQAPYMWHQWYGVANDNMPGARVESDGRYMFAGSFTSADGAKARLYSPTLIFSTPHCLTFRYYMASWLSRDLLIYRVRADNVLNVLDTRNMTLGNLWMTVAYDVSAGPLQLMFEATLNRDAIGLDNVKLTEGTCKQGDLQLYKCYHGATGVEYNGTLNQTLSGTPCIRWDAQTASTYLASAQGRFVDGSAADVINYCRNPTNAKQPWCYTSEEGQYGYCPIGNPAEIICPSAPEDFCRPSRSYKCSNGRCISPGKTCDGVNDCGDGSDEALPCDHGCTRTKRGECYTGTHQTTKGGVACDSWQKVKDAGLGLKEYILPLEASLEDSGNSCRNPDLDEFGPWCYIEGGRSRDYCDIPMCPGFPDCSPEYEFRCDDGRCVPREKECDGTTDCQDGSDEVRPCGDEFVDRLSIHRECRVTFKGTEYVGTTNVTSSATSCQRWDSQLPHHHMYTGNKWFPDDDVTDAANYCRNPGGSRSFPWCFTTDPDVEWEYCDIPVCMCDMGIPGIQYIGTLDRADNGIRCLPWTTTDKPPTDFPDPSLEAASNYCRAGNWPKPQCRTLAVAVSVVCTVPLCPGSLNKRDVSCDFESHYMCGYSTRSRPFTGSSVSPTQTTHAWKFVGSPYLMESFAFKEVLATGTDLCAHNATRGGDYLGKLSKTKSGKTCQRWDAQFPHKFDQYSDEHFPNGETKKTAENYCRNPRLDDATMWCYTTDPLQRWDYCDVPPCQASLMMAVPGEVKGVAELVSPPVDASAADVFCVRFRYILYGRGAGSLAVMVESDNGQRRQIWRITGDQGLRPVSVDLDLHDLKATWRLVFASYQSYSNSSTALDHVVLTEGACPNKKKCRDEEFLCQNGNKCLPEKHVCDSIDDCGDNSDEANCTCRGFQCSNGRCLSHILRLDGNDDCYDNSDETFVKGVTLQVSKEVYDAEESVLFTEDLPKHDYEMYPILDIDGQVFMKFWLEAAHQKDNMIHRCSWNNAPCSPTDITRTLTDFGVCYTFNDVIDNPRTTMQTGSAYGLKLVINTESYEAMEGLNSASGVKVHLHKSGTIPPVAELGFVLSPGQNALIEVSTTNTTRLPYPWGKCSSVDLKYFKGYDIATCRLECEMKTTWETCGCLAHHMPIPDTLDTSNMCGVRKYFDCYLSQLKYNQSTTMSCHCPATCEEISYTPYISYGALTDKSTTDFLGNLSARMKLEDQVKKALDASDHKSPGSYVNALNTFYDLLGHHDTLAQTLDTLGVGNKDENITSSLFLNVEKAVKIFLQMYKNSYDNIYAEFDQVFRQPMQRIRMLRDILKHFKTEVDHAYRKLFFIEKSVEASANSTAELTPNRKQYEIDVIINIKTLINVLDDYTDISTGKLLLACPTGGLNTIKNTTRALRDLGEVLTLGTKYTNRTQFWLPASSQRFSQITDSLLECLDSPLRLLGQLDNMLSQHDPGKYQGGYFGRLQRLLRNIDVRELQTPIVQARQLYKGSINMYQLGRITKLALLTELHGGLLENIQRATDYAINNILATLFEPYLHMLHDLLFDLKDSYFVLLSVLDELQIYVPEDFFDNVILSMELWKRPLVRLDVTFDRLSPRYDSEQIATYTNLSVFLRTRAKVVIDEHVVAFSEPFFYELYKYMKKLIDIDGKLETLINHIDKLIESTLRKAQLDDNFIRENFILAEFFVSQLSYNKIADQKAFRLEDLMGDVGGFMGLLVGGSLISVLEILDLFMFYVCSRIWRGRGPTEEVMAAPQA